MGTHSRNQEKNGMAAGLLYAVSVIGWLTLLGTKGLTGAYDRMVSLDAWVYLGLFVLAVLIHRGVKVARAAYALAAIVWFVALIGFLPERFGHAIDAYAVFMQLVATVLAFVILCTSQTKHAKSSLTS